MFVGGSAESQRSAFVECFGADGPDSTIWVLRWARFDCFRESLLESDMLKSHREALATQGVNADLSVHKLGLGKLFVPSELGVPALFAIHKLVRERGHTLMQSEVIVTSGLEPFVTAAIDQGASRKNYVKCRTPLALTPDMRVKNGFYDDPRK